MGSSQAIRALSALFFLSACSLAAAQRCPDTQAPKINSVITEVRGVQVNGGTAAQVAQDPADGEQGSAVIKITGVIEQLDRCTLNGVANSASPPTSANLVIKLQNGIATNTETITAFVAQGNGLYNFEFNTQTSYLNGKTQEYTYTVEAVNNFASTTTEKNPADNTAATNPLAFKFATFAGADAAVAALTAVSIGCPVNSATTMKATTFAPEVNIPGPLAVTCCSVVCVITGSATAAATTVTFNANSFTPPATKLTIEKITATIAQPLVGHVFLSNSPTTFNALTWANAEIEGDGASTIDFAGAQNFGGSTVFTGATTVDTKAQNVDITAGNKLFILEDVIWNIAGGTHNIAAGSVWVVGTNSPTNSRSPGVTFTSTAACTVAGNGQISHIGGDIVFDGHANGAIGSINSACPVNSEKKTEATGVASHPTALFTSNPNLYCCFATCGSTISINQGATMIMGRRGGSNCAGLVPPKFLGKADTIQIAPDNKGGSVRFENVDTTTSNFQLNNPVSNTANGAVVATLGPNIPVTPATIKLFDQPINGASTVPQFIPAPPAHRTRAFSTVNGIYSILLGATILPTPTQSNGVASPVDTPAEAPTTPPSTVASSDDTSDKGLYGLFGLLLLPILACLAICYFMKAKTDKADAQYAQDTAAFANVATAPTQGVGMGQASYAGQGGYAMA